MCRSLFSYPSFFILIMLVASCHHSSPHLLKPETTSLEIPLDVSLPDIEDYLSNTDSIWQYYNQQAFKLYKAHAFECLWLDAKGLNTQGQALVNILKSSSEWGLLPAYYPLPEMKDVASFNNHQLNFIDLTISYHAMNFLTHVKVGVVSGREKWLRKENESFRDSVTETIRKILIGDDINRLISESEPQMYWYQNLKKSIHQKGVPDFWPNDHDYFVNRQDEDKTLLTALIQTGFYKGLPDDKNIDRELLLHSFQRKWGLPQTGIVDINTCTLLYRQCFDVFKKVSLNMERLRSLTPDVDTYLWVNIPAFSLDVVEHNKYLYSHNVIVGTPETPTPILSGRMSHVLTYPRWNIPPSIIKKEIIPAMRKDSNYLAKKGYEVHSWSGQRLSSNMVLKSGSKGDYYPFNVSQPSGADNALGILKFLFDNNESVYLHDTNSRSLFARKFRALSHGCIRVQDPFKMAAFLLDSTSLLQMNKQMDARRTGHIVIRKPVGIYIRYLTCRASENGLLTWYNDIYNRDEAMWEKMQDSLIILTPGR